MDALEMSLLFDYYGGMLTDKQSQCFDMRYNQDLSLAEIAEEMGVSRQAVCDTLNRTESLLRKMESKIGYVSKDLKIRSVLTKVVQMANELAQNSDNHVSDLAESILHSVKSIEE